MFVKVIGKTVNGQRVKGTNGFGKKECVGVSRVERR